jgi:hypothetical protein
MFKAEWGTESLPPTPSWPKRQPCRCVLSVQCSFVTDLKMNQLGMVVQVCNPSTWETEAGG